MNAPVSTLDDDDTALSVIFRGFQAATDSGRPSTISRRLAAFLLQNKAALLPAHTA